MFKLIEEDLIGKKAIHTATEIAHQPEVWQELFVGLSHQREVFEEFKNNIQSKHDRIRVIFTGAGTSAFVGETLVPALSNSDSLGKVKYEAISTTDIVSNPSEYLNKTIPTLMVSFARSGNSPESIAAVKLGEQFVEHLYHLVITCNKDGQLAELVKNNERCMTVLTPDKAHDKGFAMTSSFTSMVLATYLLFMPATGTETTMNKLVADAEKLIASVSDSIDDISLFDFERIVYLGSGLLGQLSHEAALKMLELTAGKVVAIHESSLGFRHGPKSILNDRSLVVLFMSQDPYTRQYDVDILRELAADNTNIKIVALTEKEDAEVKGLADWMIPVNVSEGNYPNDFYLALLYIIFAQMLSLRKSLQLNITPDNPSPGGLVNRVVKGVTIYGYE